MELQGSFSVNFILKKVLKWKVTLQIHNLSYTKTRETKTILSTLNFSLCKKIEPKKYGVKM